MIQMLGMSDSEVRLRERGSGKEKKVWTLCRPAIDYSRYVPSCSEGQRPTLERGRTGVPKLYFYIGLNWSHEKKVLNMRNLSTVKSLLQLSSNDY